LTHSPPSSAPDSAALSREQAAAAFDSHAAPPEWLSAKARLAIMSPPGFLVSASPAVLALFGVEDCAALEARLVRGEGPSARRLRHLAAVLPQGEPSRLEQVRLVIGGRPSGVNLRCLRVGAPGGASWFLVSVPALGAADDSEPAASGEREGLQPRHEAAQSKDLRASGFDQTPPPNSRFLWTLDETGRFGTPHPTVVAALGANAPQPGESVQELLYRAALDGGDELVRVLGERQTFSGVTVGWPLSGIDRRRIVALSAAPVFGRHREFLGYRGFGLLGGEFEVAALPRAGLSTDAEDDRSGPEALDSSDPRKTEAQARETAAELAGPNLEPLPPPMDLFDPSSEPSLEADGATFASTLPEAVGPESLPAEDQQEAVAQAPEAAPEPIAAHLELSPADVADAPPEASVETEETASVSAPSSEAHQSTLEPVEPNLKLSLTDISDAASLGIALAAGDAHASQAEAEQADLAHRPAASEPPPERSAEIYVLRHPAAPFFSNIVPIRPGALDALAREAPQSLPAESVELSRSERDAFREIARALVGRAPAARDDRSDERGGGDVQRELGIDALAAQLKDRQGELAAARGADDEQVRRNAGALLDRLPVGVLISRDGRALYANRTLLELIGYHDFAEFQAANGLSKMFRDRDPRGLAADDVGAVAIVKADGQILSVDGHAQVIGWDGAPATLIALRRSLEAELKARMRAAESEAPPRSGLASDDFQAMLDRASDGAVTLDLAGRILSLNEPAERLFGYQQNEIAGESVLMLLAPPSHPETTARLESLSFGGEIEAAFRPLQVVGRDRNGASIPLALTLARIGPSEAPQFCALVRDLSRERETERRLIAMREAAEAASAAKTDFLAQVSHEIRTPLHAILGFAEVMLEERFGPVGNERYKDYLKDIHASGSHVMSLADDLLDISKIEAGKLDLAFVSVDANSVIRECVSLMQPQAARERVIMRVSLHDRLPRVMVDERSLKQIMLNLMSNAVKFNEPGGQVIVSTAVDAAGQAVIRVRDTGVGMNESEVGLALTPFSQVGKPGAKGGAGLGLPLTKALVEANKAEFSIKSRREQGTLIEIAFPNVQAAQ
jgi:PAS domain S-box-containing protein